MNSFWTILEAILRAVEEKFPQSETSKKDFVRDRCSRGESELNSPEAKGKRVFKGGGGGGANG